VNDVTEPLNPKMDKR